MRPKDDSFRMAEQEGLKGIEFKESPSFSYRYWVKREAQVQIRHIMNRKVLHFFTMEQNWCMEGLNNFLVLYKQDQELSTDEIKGFYPKVLGLSELMKRN